MTETQRGGLQEWVAARPQIWMGLMLLTLHASLAWGIEAWWARAFLLAHFGFFLMWQPVWRADEALSPSSALSVMAVGGLLVFGANWWLAAVWLGVLIGLIGGRAFGIELRRTRVAAMLAVTYLLGILLGWVVPHLFGDYAEFQEVTLLMRYGLLVFPVAIFFVGHEAEPPATTHVVDFIYSLMLFLLVMVLVLGSFAIKVISREHYLLSLAGTLVAVGVMLLVLAWLWKPRAGFAGFGQLLSRYLLSVGLPFEQWLKDLARLSEEEREPDAFLRQAMQEIERLPWVSGGSWRTLDDRGEFGLPTAHCIEFSVNRLGFDLYTRGHTAPALTMHTKLLLELIEFFYDAKLREQLQRQNAYVQAIHETGARLTHDVKNLLQSLTTLCAAAESSEADQAEALQGLIKRQLPLIAERLGQTLKKLKAPHTVGKEEIAASAWWKNLRTRYEDQQVEFQAEGEVNGTLVPGELFDSVADNLLQNALKKRAAQPGILIRVSLLSGPKRTFTVCDTGSPMNAETANRLFDAPVASSTGLGIGLYQAARQAEQLGYQLHIAHNEVGRVCFELRPALKLVVANEGRSV